MTHYTCAVDTIRRDLYPKLAIFASSVTLKKHEQLRIIVVSDELIIQEPQEQLNREYALRSLAPQTHQRNSGEEASLAALQYKTDSLRRITLARVKANKLSLHQCQQ